MTTPQDYEHDYDYYYLALKNPSLIGKIPELPIHDGDPQCGFWRQKEGPGGLFEPVAIWRFEGKIVAVAGKGRSVNADDVWLFCCTRPIEETAYHHWKGTGNWDDCDEGVTASLEPPPIGHNAPSDPAEQIADQIEAAKAGIDAYVLIEDDKVAAKAQSLRSRLLELFRDSEKLRKEETAPHMDATKAVNLRYMPLSKDAKASADLIAKALGAFETKKARQADKERREAVEEARKAEAEAAKAAAAGEACEPAPPPPPEPEALPTQIKGGHGRAASIKVVRVITKIRDWEILCAYLHGEPEFDAMVMKLAQKEVNNGHTVPGVTVEEQRKVA